MRHDNDADWLSLEEMRDLPRRRRELACADGCCGGCWKCLEAQSDAEVADA